MTRIQHAVLTTLAIAVGGCGASISPQLVEARGTLSDAEGSLAARLEPDELLEAQRLLALAEQQADGSEAERHYAYLADRHAQVAMAHARTAHLRAQVTAEQDAYIDELEDTTIARSRALDAQGRALADVQSQLSDVRTALGERGSTLDAQTRELRERERELAQREAELRAERERREEAERRAAEAMARLSELAQIREEANETVITLSGEVLFETNRAEVRGTAQRRLEAVAEALRAQPDRRITVVGHTDTRGSATHNEELSRRRAEAVMGFLVEQGIPAERISALGRGESQPIAPNDTPEGRANNRRVEIVLSARAEAASPEAAETR